mmetsp:Transcript_31571/g.62441  ORF Transcript_31571/g.62441 Transcript_31571/m.62441 type:complete len:139 (-) Transcript_31571:503-919(-)
MSFSNCMLRPLRLHLFSFYSPLPPSDNECKYLHVYLCQCRSSPETVVNFFLPCPDGIAMCAEEERQTDRIVFSFLFLFLSDRQTEREKQSVQLFCLQTGREGGRRPFFSPSLQYAPMPPPLLSLMANRLNQLMSFDGH